MSSPSLRLRVLTALLALPFLPMASPAQTAAPNTHRFQFGAAQAAPGYTVLAPGAVFSDATGFGFEPGANLEAVQNAAGEPLQRGAVTSSTPFQFSVAVPEGNYRVTVTLGHPTRETVATVKAERRRLMVERTQVPAGRFATHTFIVNVRTPRISSGGQVNLNDREHDRTTGVINTLSWDNKLTIGLSNTSPSRAALEIEPVTGVPTVYLLGDSTVTDQGRGGSWGQMLPRWFGPTVAVANHAESGETFKGFLMHRRWDKVLDGLKAGDYVLMQFGTNDSKDSGAQNMYTGQDFSATYAAADTTYREMLQKFVTDVRAFGAIPVVISPPARRGETSNPSSLSAWAIAAMETARHLGVPSIDLNTLGQQFNAALGADADRQFSDRTHHSEYGAYLLAKGITHQLSRMQLPLKEAIVADFSFDPANPQPRPSDWSLPNDTAPAGGRGGQ